MRYVFDYEAWNDYLYWQINDKQKLRKINELIKDISRNPYQGLGDPEPLKHDFSGYWSRRIDKRHRLVYAIENDAIIIMKCRFHYDE